MGKTVVMSDMHFGLKNSSLSINSYDTDENKKLTQRHIDNLFKWFEKEHEDIDEFIFIGDIFDLHLQHFQEAISGSYYFLEKLSKLNNLKKIIYIPGNHDHTMWLLHVYYSDIILNFKNNAYPNFTDDFFNLQISEFSFLLAPKKLNFTRSGAILQINLTHIIVTSKNNSN